MNVQIYLEDCIQGMHERLAPESVDLTVTSIPFASLFMYSGKTEDVGNSPDAGLDFVGSQFGLHMRYFIEQLFRVHKSGTIVCIHVQQLLTFKIQHGFMGRRDFRGAVVDLFSAGGFDWKGEIVIPKDPQAAFRRSKLHSLQLKTGGERSGRDLAPYVNDYVMIFQKPGHAVPVRCLKTPANPHGWVTKEEWYRDACGVWVDINEIDVLEGYKGATEEDDEKHVCPLQLEVIRRCIKLYSNPGETVLDPFGGIGSVPCITVELGRNAVSFELKESYCDQMCRNVEKWQHRGESGTVDIFSLLEVAE